MQFREHRQNLKYDLLEKSKVAHQVYEMGYRVDWDEVRILEAGNNSRYRNYKELDHMVFLTNQISQRSLDISPIWIFLTSSEVSNSQRKSV